MKHWLIIEQGVSYGLAATVAEIEERFGSEGRDWYSRHRRGTADQIIVLRRLRGSKT